MRHHAGRIALFILIVAGAVLLLAFANYRFALQQPGGNDFLARWTGAHAWIVEGINPYDPAVSLAAQQMIYGREADPAAGEDVAHFVYPLPAMLFFAPFGLLPYTLARALWMTLLEISLPLLVFLSLRWLDWRPGKGLLAFFLFFSMFWYHGVRAVVVGQFAVVEAVLMLLALLLYHRRRDTAAGISLALTIAKPQMAFLLIPFLLVHAVSRRRWRFVLSSAGAFVVLMLASELLLPGWLLDWIRQLQDYPAYTSIGSPISILAGFVPGAKQVINIVLTAALLGGMLWSWLRACREGGEVFLKAAMLTLVVTNLVAFRTATTNYVVLLPVLLYIVKYWVARSARRGTIAAVLAMIILLVGIWVLFLLTVDGNIEGALPYLPLPLLTLAGVVFLSPGRRPEDDVREFSGGRVG